jgi:hypothetical protein
MIQVPPIHLTPEETFALEQLFARVGQLAAVKQGWGRNCLGCFFFNEQAEFCDKWKARPPARTIVQGCAAYDPAPF